MRKQPFIPAVLLFAVAAGPAAAGNPFAGTWKLNPEKSKFAGSTVAYEKLPSGEWKSTAAGMSHTFQMDGKEYEGLFGRKVTWKQVSERTWESTVKAGGILLVTQRHEISPDNATMTVTSEGTMPNGDKFKDVSVYTRQSGSAGLAGKWKSQKVQISTPTVLEIKPRANGIIMMLPAYKASVDMAFDGTETAPVGPTVPKGLMFSARKVDEQTFEFAEKHGGKPIYSMTFKVSADGQTLIETGKPAGADEPFTAVYERQK